MEYLNQSVIQSGYKDQLTSKTTFVCPEGGLISETSLYSNKLKVKHQFRLARTSSSVYTGQRCAVLVLGSLNVAPGISLHLHLIYNSLLWSQESHSQQHHVSLILLVGIYKVNEQSTITIEQSIYEHIKISNSFH